MNNSASLETRGVDTYDFINKLRNDKLFTIKQLSYIEQIVLYISNLNVYKIIIYVYPTELKKARKIGLKDPIIVHEGNFGTIKEPLPNTKSGKFMLIYKPYNQDITVWEGENVRLQSVQKYKSRRF